MPPSLIYSLLREKVGNYTRLHEKLEAYEKAWKGPDRNWEDLIRMAHEVSKVMLDAASWSTKGSGKTKGKGIGPGKGKVPGQMALGSDPVNRSDSGALATESRSWSDDYIEAIIDLYPGVCHSYIMHNVVCHDCKREHPMLPREKLMVLKRALWERKERNNARQRTIRQESLSGQSARFCRAVANGMTCKYGVDCTFLHADNKEEWSRAEKALSAWSAKKGSGQATTNPAAASGQTCECDPTALCPGPGLWN